MRNKLLLFYTLLLVLCFGGYAAYTQHTLKNAQTFYLQMAPLDPLALLSGEYMQINYAFEQDVFGINAPVKQVTLYVDARGVAGRAKTDKPLVIPVHQVMARLPHQFYFKEGTAKKYDTAAYAQLKRLPDGRFLISALADKDLKLL